MVATRRRHEEPPLGLDERGPPLPPSPSHRPQKRWARADAKAKAEGAHGTHYSVGSVPPERRKQFDIEVLQPSKHAKTPRNKDQTLRDRKSTPLILRKRLFFGQFTTNPVLQSTHVRRCNIGRRGTNDQRRSRQPIAHNIERSKLSPKWHSD